MRNTPKNLWQNRWLYASILQVAFCFIGVFVAKDFNRIVAYMSWMQMTVAWLCLLIWGIGRAFK